MSTKKLFIALLNFIFLTSFSQAQSDDLHPKCKQKLIEIVKKEAALSPTSKSDYAVSTVTLSEYFSTLNRYFTTWGESAVEGNETHKTFKSMFDVYANANNATNYPKKIVKIEAQWVNEDSEDSFFKDMYFSVISWKTAACNASKKSTFVIWD